MLNGYCVCGFCLSMLAFVGTFFAHAERVVNLREGWVEWFRMFQGASFMMFLMGMIFSLIGVMECRKHEQFGGRGLGLAGAALGAAAAVHWGITSFAL